MPKVPPYLMGIRSYKVRNLVNLLAGVLGIAKTKDFKGPDGLQFTAVLVDHGRPGDVEWALAQAGWTCRAGTSDDLWTATTVEPCAAFGTITGELRRTHDDDGQWFLTFALYPSNGAPK